MKTSSLLLPRVGELTSYSRLCPLPNIVSRHFHYKVWLRPPLLGSACSRQIQHVCLRPRTIWKSFFSDAGPGVRCLRAFIPHSTPISLHDVPSPGNLSSLGLPPQQFRSFILCFFNLMNYHIIYHDKANASETMFETWRLSSDSIGFS